MSNLALIYKTFSSGIALCLVLFGVSQGAADGSETKEVLLAEGAGMDAGQLTDLLSSANLVRSSTDIKAINAGSGVTILAQTKPNATDRGLKVDAVFIAKALFEQTDGQVQRVKVVFSETGKPGRYVAIGKGEIAAYGAGKMTADQLLARVRLVSVNDEPVTPNLVSGPQFERRLLVWQRIDNLKKKGTGVKPFETLFADIEATITAGDTSKVSEKLAYLEEKIGAQEAQVKLAKQAASGRGMRGYQSAAAAAAAGAGGGAPLGGAMPNAAGEPGIPPNSDQIRQRYESESNQLISRLSGSDAHSLRQIKTKIEQAFASGKKGTAFQLIHQFQTEAIRLTGVDIMMGGGQGPPGGGQGGGPPGGGQGGGPPGGGQGGPPGGGHGGQGGPPGF